MKFCNKCNNKFYPIEDSQKLYYRCNDCGEQQEYDEFIISETNYNKSENIKYTEYVKKNLKYDNGLKRSQKYKCPNKDCNNIHNGECIILCDKSTLENIYICCSCLTEWKYS